MNFLAHLYLSCETPTLMVGNFLADFIKNKQLAELPAEIQKGVILHRQIDTYTDTHPKVLQGTRRLYDKHGKYASVLVDVFYDYLLVKNWARYHSEPITTFTQNAYQVLDDHIEIMPPNLQKRVPRMIADNWLLNYGTEEGMKFTFNMMKRRVSKPEWLDNPFESLKAQLNDFDKEFREFFPEVIEFVQDKCRC